LAVLLPEKEGMGLVAPYCERCINTDHGDLGRQLVEAIRDELGVEMLGMQ
jgi:hypothetical protein